MIVVVLCCHVRREMRVGILMLQNPLSWLHGCCMGFVLGESRGRKPCVFPCKVAPAGDERYLVCVAGAVAIEPSANRFLLCVLQRVVVHVCVVLCVS